MFTPNVRAKLRRQKGTDLYGKAMYAPLVGILCGIVRLESVSGTTSVRTDSSASRGSAMEETSISRILVPAYVNVKKGDEIIVGDFQLTVSAVQPRYNIAGKLDHWQLELGVAADTNTSIKLSVTP